MTIVGEGGEVRVGYQLAARLGRWTWEISPKTVGVITATLIEPDAWWITQPPTELRLTTRDADWVWAAPVPRGSGVWKVPGAPRIELRADESVSVR